VQLYISRYLYICNHKNYDMSASRPPASKTVLTTASSRFVEHQLAPLWWHLHPVRTLCTVEHIKRMVCSILAVILGCMVQMSALLSRRLTVDSPVMISTSLQYSSVFDLLTRSITLVIIPEVRRIGSVR
jgi:hypothetical protein